MPPLDCSAADRFDETGVFTWIHSDHLGSASAATNSAGDIIWRESYTPFGEAIEDPAANRDEAEFTGHITDHATGLTYAQARYYNPVTARFLSADPVGFADEGPGYFNRYAYTMNDPVNLVDPDGEQAQDVGVSLFNFASARSANTGEALNVSMAATNEALKAEITCYANVDGNLAIGEGGADASVNVAVETLAGIIPSGASISVSSPKDGVGSIDGGALAAGINLGAQVNDLSGFHSPAKNLMADVVGPGVGVTLPGSDGRGAGVEIGIGAGAGITRSETRTDPIIAVRAPWSPGFRDNGAVERAFDEK